MLAVSAFLLLLVSPLSEAAWRPNWLRHSAPSANKVRRLSSPRTTWSRSEPAPIVLKEGDALSLCDCESAQLSLHGGLQCEKEGYFIYDFEAVGRWMTGGGQVPLSRARCCRICKPDSISSETSALMPEGANATAVVTVGCHATTTKGQVSCESDPDTTFITGFQHAVMVPNLAAATFYPAGPATCCSPALMLDTGDAWEIERCDCSWSSSPGCSDAGDDYLLWGYPVFRNGGSGRHVPIAPSQCCRACLGSKIHRLSDCSAQQNCNHRGVCVLGTCQCNDGWGGADCSQPLGHKSWPPAWFTYAMMGLTVLVSVIAWLTARHILHDFVERRREAQEEQAQLLDPLIVAEGEIGDEDTDDDSPAPGTAIQMTDTAVRRAAAAASSTRAASRSNSASAAYAAQQVSARQEPAASPSGQELQEHREPLLPDAVESAAPAERPKPTHQHGDDVGSEDSGEESEDEALRAQLADKFDERKSPLSRVKCSICFDRPVQVALVPCGHSNLCRKCARRMEYCAFCRKPVVRRQRLYLANEQ